MGKLADKIRAVRTRADRPLGFGAAANRGGSPARGLLIAAAGESGNGADLLIGGGDLADAGGLKGLAAAGGGALVGVEARGLSRRGADAAEQAGIDFLLFQIADAHAEALFSGKLDYALRLETVPEEPTLRAIGSLRPVFVLVAPVSDPFTAQRLIELRQIALGTGAPLATPVPPDLGVGSLEALRETGVAVLVLASPTSEQIAALRDRIATIPARSRRPRDEESVALPSLLVAADEEEDD